MPKDRKNHTPKEKVAILRRHLLDHVPVSQLCDEYHLQPTLFYRWQKQFFEQGEVAFALPARNNSSAPFEQKISALEQRLARKNEVVAELLEEHVQLRKSINGEA